MCSSPATGAIGDKLAALATPAPEPDDDPTLLHELPVITAADLTVVPEDLLRDLYESFNLEVRTTHRNTRSPFESRCAKTAFPPCTPP
jgi:hypothetical protein